MTEKIDLLISKVDKLSDDLKAFGDAMVKLAEINTHLSNTILVLNQGNEKQTMNVVMTQQETGETNVKQAITTFFKNLIANEKNVDKIVDGTRVIELGLERQYFSTQTSFLKYMETYSGNKDLLSWSNDVWKTVCHAVWSNNYTVTKLKELPDNIKYVEYIRTKMTDSNKKAGKAQLSEE
jgi:hypothetical protein